MDLSDDPAMEKQYAIIRINSRCSRTAIGQAHAHGIRSDTSIHVDRSRSHLNQFWVPNLGLEDPMDLIAAVDRVTEVLGARRRSDNAGLLADFHVGASPEYFLYDDGREGYDPDKIQGWTDYNIEVFNRKFPGQVAQVRLDMDEKTPHLAVFVIPTYEKSTKRGTALWVSYRKVFGGNKHDASEKCIALQDWYAEEMACLGLHRGEPKEVTGAVHTHHNTYRQIEAKKSKETQLALDEANAAKAQYAELVEKQEETLASIQDDREALDQEQEKLDTVKADFAALRERELAAFTAERFRLDAELEALAKAKAGHAHELTLLAGEKAHLEQELKALERAQAELAENKVAADTNWQKMIAGLTRAAEVMATEKVKRDEKGTFSMDAHSRHLIGPIWHLVRPIFQTVHRKMQELDKERKAAQVERDKAAAEGESLRIEQERLVAELAVVKADWVRKSEIFEELTSLREEMTPDQHARLKGVAEALEMVP